MQRHEKISENCKMLWKESYKPLNKEYTQVSGYIFNEKNQLLIVKNDKDWTIPGGHPEPEESSEATLVREVMEEAYVLLKDIKYLGAVEVVEEEKTYYQLRYTAKAKAELIFKKEWETQEKRFVNLDELNKYISWANGITFQNQLNSAKKIWGI